jgi:hypothetical protein
MHGKTHAVHGAIAGGAIGALSGDIRFIAAGMGLGALAALGPDVDHHASAAGKMLPPVRHLMRGLSWSLGLPLHRGITHTVLMAVAVGATTLVILPWLLALAVTAGWLAALAGDWCTKTSLPYLWWPLTGPQKVRFKFLRITTGKGVERNLVYPASVVLLVVGLAFVIWV